VFSFYTLVLATPNFKLDRYSSSAMSLSAASFREFINNLKQTKSHSLKIDNATVTD